MKELAARGQGLDGFILQRRIPKPKYRVTDEEYYRETELAERVARQLSDSDLQRRIAESVRIKCFATIPMLNDLRVELDEIF